MADKVPATFKTVLPFIRRAEELDRDTSRPESKLIAYFCRQYAMELGIKLRENDPSNEATEYLLGLMDRLEEEKNKLPAFTQEEGKEICEDFALEVFSKADDEDRSGRADKNTARTFYAAGTFFDILNQFGDTPEDIVEKRRYCKYKAATILKALKEGQVPTPGPPESFANLDNGNANANEEEKPSPMSSIPSVPIAAPAYSPVEAPTPTASKSEPEGFPSFTGSASIPSSADNSFTGTNWNQPSPQANYSAPSPPAPVYNAPPPPAPVYNTPPPAAPVYSAPTPPAPVYQAPPPPAPVYSAPPSAPMAQPAPSRSRAGAPSQNEINDAIECAKFAIAALKIKDIDLAVHRLELALRNIR